MRQCNVPLPPLLTQRAIADYLDRETARIDGLIAAKQRMVELLHERLDAITENLVDANRCGEIRSSEPGVHPLIRLKYVAALQAGEAITSHSIEDAGPYPVFGGNGIRGYSDSYTHECDAVLIGRQGALCGNINYATGRFWASEHAIVARVEQGTDLTWFGELLRAMNLNQYSQSAAQPGLSVGRISNLVISLPPTGEQHRLGEKIRQAIAQTVPLRDSHQLSIDLLLERRQALITAAVTGQLDMLEVA